MNSKYFLALTVILIILFSLSTATASENISVSDDSRLSIETPDTVSDKINENANDSPEILTGEEDSVDLSVEIDFENVYVGDEFNTVGCEVPWTITAKAIGGTAHNVKVHESLNGKMSILSVTPSKGTFNQATGIWDIGDLASSETATLTILTKVLENGRFVLTADATTDSMDTAPSNNHDQVAVNSGYNKTNSNITETTAQKQQTQHDKHYQSTGKKGFVEREHKTESGTKKERKTSKGYSKIKSANSYGNMIYNAYGLVSNSAASVLNPDAEDSKSDQQDDESIAHILGIPSYDYTKIPIFIFALFLIALGAIIGFDRIKS